MWHFLFEFPYNFVKQLIYIYFMMIYLHLYDFLKFLSYNIIQIFLYFYTRVFAMKSVLVFNLILAFDLITFFNVNSFVKFFANLQLSFHYIKCGLLLIILYFVWISIKNNNSTLENFLKIALWLGEIITEIPWKIPIFN